MTGTDAIIPVQDAGNDLEVFTSKAYDLSENRSSLKDSLVSLGTETTGTLISMADMLVYALKGQEFSVSYYGSPTLCSSHRKNIVEKEGQKVEEKGKYCRYQLHAKDSKILLHSAHDLDDEPWHYRCSVLINTKKNSAKIKFKIYAWINQGSNCKWSSPIIRGREPKKAFEILADRYLKGSYNTQLQSLWEQYPHIPVWMHQMVADKMKDAEKEQTKIMQRLEKIRSLDVLLR